MEYDTFCRAVDSVMDHPGLIGVMGGEPTLHPRFADMCQYLYEKLPKEKLTPPDAFTLPTDSFIEVRRRQMLMLFTHMRMVCVRWSWEQDCGRQLRQTT